jgi:hypothetical protein
MQTAIVKYKIGSHGGKLNVLIEDNDSDDVVIEKAEAQLFKEAGTEMPMENISFTILVGEASPLENRINEVQDS